MLNFEPYILLVTIITFLIGMVLIWNVFLKRFLRVLEDRAAGVKDNIESAEKNKTEAESLRLEYQKHLDEIDKKVQRAIKDATKEGIELKNEIILKARQEAKNVLDKTYEKIDLEKEKMLKELKTEVVNMSVTIAEKIIKENLSHKVNDRMVDEVLAEIERGGKYCRQVRSQRNTLPRFSRPRSNSEMTVRPGYRRR